MAKRIPMQPPENFDEAALECWREWEPKITNCQRILFENLCQNHSNLRAVRKAKAAAKKSGTFEAMAVAKNGVLGPHPLVRQETKLLAIENRMLVALGIGEDRFWS
jgi:hypothetical protein